MASRSRIIAQALNTDESRLFFFWKGRVALYAILKALGVGKGDEVIIPGYTCVVVPFAIKHLGAKPVYADIRPDIFCLDPKEVREKITRNTKVIVAQHTYGIIGQMHEMKIICRDHGITLIEDSCHAIGGRLENKEVGSLGDAAFFSSQWSKPVTTGLGGWAKINNDELREKMEETYQNFKKPPAKAIHRLKMEFFAYQKLMTPSVYWYAQGLYRTLTKAGVVTGSSSSSELMGEMPDDYQYKMSGWQLGKLAGELHQLNELINHRVNIQEIYHKLLSPETGSLKWWNDKHHPVILRYPVMVRNKPAILEKARQNRVELGDWFNSPVHPELEHMEVALYPAGCCPNGEGASKHCINLPTHQKVTEKRAKKIVEFVLQHAELMPYE